VSLFKKKNISISEIALISHYGQKRRSGDPYIIHPERVMQIVKNYYPKNKMAIMIAILHDSLEECCSDNKNSIFCLIKQSLKSAEESEELIKSIKLLTRDRKTSYDDYVLNLLNHKNLVIVKVADILDNLRDKPTENQLLKYKKAINVISRKFNGRPEYIHPSHWNSVLKIIS
jgi:GTP pyrophosphokinase